MYTDTKGSRPIQFTWELTGNSRIDLTGSSTHSVVFNGAASTATGGLPSASDDDLMESLGDDRAETLLYSRRQPGFSMRFIGNHFRTDDGASKTYTGPYYDILQTTETVAVRSDKALRRKLFLFDSGTQLLVKATYQVVKAGASVKVDTVYSGWSTVGGQAVPGQITRTENGVNVFTIQMKSAQVTPTANDAVFAHL